MEAEQGDERLAMVHFARGFHEALGLSGPRWTLWGRWTMVSGESEQSVSISSALVSSSRSEALLGALQTAANPFDYRIPDEDDDLQIEHDGFQLKGWVADQKCSSLLDEYDPWAGEISYPGIAPGKFVRRCMQLTSDSEERTWYTPADKGPHEVLWSQVWGQTREKDNDRPREHGRRLQGTPGFVVDLLRTVKMDLIIEVQLERELCNSRYSERGVGGYEFIPKSARLFLVKTDGSVITV
jgi:hypothetical protein